MALLDTFSRRKRASSGQATDVYVYDTMPEKVRVQIVLLLQEAIGAYGHSGSPVAGVWNELVRRMRQEKGVFRLCPGFINSPEEEFSKWLLSEADLDTFIDGLELACQIINTYIRENEWQFRDYRVIDPDEAITTINARMLEASIGYQFVSGEIIQLNNTFMHAEVVVPVLSLLNDKRFASADTEFKMAHELFRKGKYELCLVECCKSLESVLKVIGTARKWPITTNDPPKKLIDAAYGANFIEPHMQTAFTALRSLLESGVPVVRNKQGGHGAGIITRVIPQHLAAFQLHQTAAAILFLMQQDAALP